jgi:uncharacterized protein
MVTTPTIHSLSQPLFFDKSQQLAEYIESLSSEQIRAIMKISQKLSLTVGQIHQRWLTSPHLSAAVECFRGDIYSGLRAFDWTENDKKFAQDHLKILSGLYGMLRPYDAVAPYRLEAAYRFPATKFSSIYNFWNNEIAQSINSNSIVNLSSQEYSKLVLPYVPKNTVIVSPRFLTQNSNGETTFIVVHAKIARGAFARWLIKNKVKDIHLLKTFNDLNYAYNDALSTPSQPVYVCKEFKCIGLSQRALLR